MQDKTTIYYLTHRWMKLHEQVQPYVFHTSFLYVSCLKHIKLDQDLIHILIERWRRETQTLYPRYGEMTSTLQEMTILLRLPIDG
jgi:hypothetical protein